MGRRERREDETNGSGQLDPRAVIFGGVGSLEAPDTPRRHFVSGNEFELGRVEWRLADGTIHRESGPAVEYEDGSKEWRRHGLCHRDGPWAAVYLSPDFAERGGDFYDAQGGLDPESDRYTSSNWGQAETELWFQEGRLHREDGPAVVEQGVIEGEHYFRHGLYHREDGPAFVRHYLDGGDPPISIWFRQGHLHREDGPALIEGGPDDEDRCEAWFRDNKLHREDGPAVVVPSGAKPWALPFDEDETGGYPTALPGSEHYYLDGTPLAKEEWMRRVGI